MGKSYAPREMTLREYVRKLEADIQQLTAENVALRKEVEGYIGLLATSNTPIGEPKPLAIISHPDVRP